MVRMVKVVKRVKVVKVVQGAGARVSSRTCARAIAKRARGKRARAPPWSDTVTRALRDEAVEE
eukprot:12280029-Karenia_brevis.AAC.1